MTSDLYSAASSAARSVSGLVLDELGLDPEGGARAGARRMPIRARRPARSTAAGAPPARRPTCSMVATTPWVA